jgi:hypothetical protein
MRPTYTGKSLVAANWLRIGQTQGRGRTSPSKKARPQSIKDVWVWQWDRQARAQLQARRLPLVVPRSIFSASEPDGWVAEELDGLALGHAVIERRFAQMLQDRWAHPDWSFYTSFGGAPGGNAAYAFLENGRAQLQFATLLAPHQQQTRRRMAAESVVLLAQDTTALSYHTLLETTGLGPIGDERSPGRGLLRAHPARVSFGPHPLGLCLGEGLGAPGGLRHRPPQRAIHRPKGKRPLGRGLSNRRRDRDPDAPNDPRRLRGPRIGYHRFV